MKQKLRFTLQLFFYLSLLLCFSLVSNPLEAQVKKNVQYISASILGDDTIPLVYLRPIHVEATGGIITQAKRIGYYKMKRDVRAALPYAKIAGDKLREINETSIGIKNERLRKKYIKEEEKKMKELFAEELKNLTVTQGRVLIKLIDRETGATTYDLVKELRGSLNAFLWQGVAHLWGSDLKVQYDPRGEDALMEQIVVEVESEKK